MIALWLVWAASAVSAQSPILTDDVHDIAKQLNCPTCAGRNLADCPTETCNQWKSEIAAQLQQGKNSTEIVTYFEQRFGTTVLQEPPKAGQTLVLWIVPVVAFAALAGAAVLAVRRASRRSQATAPGDRAVGEGDDPYAAELERQV